MKKENREWLVFIFVLISFSLTLVAMGTFRRPNENSMLNRCLGRSPDLPPPQTLNVVNGMRSEAFDEGRPRIAHRYFGGGE